MPSFFFCVQENEQYHFHHHYYCLLAWFSVPSGGGGLPVLGDPSQPHPQRPLQLGGAAAVLPILPRVRGAAAAGQRSVRRRYQGTAVPLVLVTADLWRATVCVCVCVCVWEVDSVPIF